MTMATRIVVMKDGLIQQVETPQRLYDYPNNMFVAGFIGSPMMNFLNGTLVKPKGSDKLYFEFANGRAKDAHSKDKAEDEALQPYIGKEGRCGIRPELHRDDARSY